MFGEVTGGPHRRCTSASAGKCSEASVCQEHHSLKIQIIYGNCLNCMVGSGSCSDIWHSQGFLVAALQSLVSVTGQMSSLLQECHLPAD